MGRRFFFFGHDAVGAWCAFELVGLLMRGGGGEGRKGDASSNG